MDAYQTTDPRPVRFLLPHLQGVRSFAEPCDGDGHLMRQLTSFGLTCTYSGDIQRGQDALKLERRDCGSPDVYITNPPWTRALLHPLIRHLMSLGPTWLLFDSDWAFNVQAVPLIRHCSHIVAVGRVKWIEQKRSSGKDNAAWYRFHIQHHDGPRFVPRGRLSATGGKHDDDDSA